LYKRKRSRPYHSTTLQGHLDASGSRPNDSIRARKLTAIGVIPSRDHQRKDEHRELVFDHVRDTHLHQDYLDRLPHPDTGIARREETFPYHAANEAPQASSVQPRPSELTQITRLCQPALGRTTSLTISRWVDQVYLE
jgi:hypothetical protein